ncbi:hypothetical protein [Geothrix sp.]|uniref:hypothetical protein n=1 Tax=Geothrix sp. TaxID=1962974 RepID=UPI0026377CF0|nr:hypothetical protein [Geothrix sp.]WIL19278.1 MAG: hypothetical protein QOZ81_001788 [Geothrix sp.]WIL19807.1 MAG: hypothetical protein QOZ81_002340 [Geothrix sp.]
MSHEEAFVKAFITSEKQARWAQFLSSSKRRKEILDRLNHNLPYIPALGTEVPGNQDFPAELEKLLKAKGAGPTCHVIVDGLKIDGQELPLSEALTQICMHEFGAVLSCIPGRLAYYKPESPNRGVILERLSR